MNALVLLALVSWGQVFCPICREQGRKSVVYPGMSTRTLMGWQPYYDEDGHYHSDDPNITTQGWSCSNHHKWTTRDGKAIQSSFDSIMPPQPTDEERTAEIEWGRLPDTAKPTACLLSLDTVAFTSGFVRDPHNSDAYVTNGRSFFHRLWWLITGRMP